MPMYRQSFRHLSTLLGGIFFLAGCTSQPKAPYYGHLLEPRAERILHGAGQNVNDFADYCEAVGPHQPVIFMSYESVRGWKHSDSSYDPNQLPDSFHDRYLIFQIGLSMTEDGQPQEHYEQDVADGKYDTRLQKLCDEWRAMDRPIFLRIGYEFNGQWNGYQPASYKAAWIHIVKMIRRNRLDQVATVWCFSTSARNLDYMSFYPGDEWVDWWSVNIFRTRDFDMQAAKRFVQDADRRRFPVIIGESTPQNIGVLQGESSWSRWFAPYFRFIHEHSNIKAFCYINRDWSKTHWSDWGDSRIGQNPYVRQQWQSEMDDPRYVHDADEPTIRKELGLPPPAFR